MKYFHETTSVKMVEREAKFLQQCSLLNFIPIIFGMHSKTFPYFIVTQAYGNDELSMSTTLYDAIKGGAASISNFKPEELLHVVSQLVEALSYIHEKNILHNDIKSDIVLAKNGDFRTPILIDFGKACLFAEVKRKVLSEKGQKIYRDSHSHIAPEVVNGTQPPASRVMYIQLVSFSLNCTEKTK